MRLKVLFFARGRELAGTSEATVELPAGSDSDALLEQLLVQVRAGRGRRVLRPGAHGHSHTCRVSHGIRAIWVVAAAPEWQLQQ